MKRPDITALLPEIFQRAALDGSPLVALLEVMEGLHEPAEEILADVDAAFDPYRARPEFLPMLGHWLGLEPPLTTQPWRARPFLARAVELWRWRGTAWAIVQSLELATGTTGFDISERTADGRARPFHFSVIAPASVSADRDLIEKVIEMQKPAYVTFELSFA
jgi:phage tail-like protein